MKCIICGKEIVGHGNNPDPITDEWGNLFDPKERCCDECNDKYVVAIRLAQLQGDMAKANHLQAEVIKLRQSNKRLIAVIERPDGSTYEQEIELIDGNIKKSLSKQQRRLGNPFDKNGCYKKDAYVVVDGFFRG